MSDRRLIFLHGFTQTHHHWHEVAHLVSAALAGDRDLVFVDLPGHGLSDGDRLTVESAAEELGVLAGAGTYIGYSMGARHALAAACAGSPAIERLVLVSGTAGIADPTERARRAGDDEARADRIMAIGVDAFVDEWLSQPLFSGLPVRESDRAHRLRNTAEGLAASLRLAGTGAQRPLWDSLPAVTIPALVLAGANDAKFVDIARRMAGAMPCAEFAMIPGAGHAAHAEQPAATANLISDWLRSDERRRQPSASPRVSSAP